MRLKSGLRSHSTAADLRFAASPGHKGIQVKSGIRDNRSRGKVAEFLKEKATSGSRLSVVSAYFTIYAYEALSDQLDGIESLKFLFGEPKFIQTLDPEKTDKKAFKIEDEGLELANRLQQKEVARRCAEWITNKVEIRSIREANLLHGKLYHVDDGRREHALMGSSNFTQRGLGLAVAVHRALQVQKTRPIELLQYLATALNARAAQLATQI